MTRQRSRFMPIGSAAGLAMSLVALTTMAPTDKTATASTPSARQGPMAYLVQPWPGIPLQTGHLYDLDLSTGQMIDLGPTSESVVQLTYDPSSARLVGVADGAPTNTSGRVVELAGNGTVSTLSGFDFAGGWEVKRDNTTGKWYNLASAFGSAYLYEIDLQTGDKKYIGFDFGVGALDFAINNKGEAYATNMQGLYSHQSLYKVDLTTGQFTKVGPLRITEFSSNHSSFIDFDANGTLWGLSGGTTSEPARLFTIDTQTGEATFERFIDIPNGWYGGMAIVR